MNAIADMRRSTPPSQRFPDRHALRSTLDPLAVEDDRTDNAPIDGLKYLVTCGAAQAVLPSSLGGAEFGWSRRSSHLLAAWLRAIGGTHLSLARLYEGHVNAFQLVWTYGDAAQRDALCRYVNEGGWLGVWNAPHASGPLNLLDESGTLMLDGMKAYASGAGLINRPLITAAHETRGYVMVWPNARYHVGSREHWEMHGMRASITLPVQYHRAAVREEDVIGADNDYHREPLFTTGAWRFLAAQVGAGERLAALMAEALVASRRDGDPHQRARMAEVAMAIESSLQWLERARHAADGQLPDDEAMHMVRMARLAIEGHLLQVLEHVHRSVGLTSFRRDHPIERMSRDLQTYLRQPVPDLVRDKIGEQAFGVLACHEVDA
jgi:alkylation response protein AidB-like acyl-CoA dehydrogenase